MGVDGSLTSDWFMIKSGVKQGCVMSGFLFSLCFDWVMIEEGNSKQEKSDKVEFHKSAGGP